MPPGRRSSRPQTRRDAAIAAAAQIELTRAQLSARLPLWCRRLAKAVPTDDDVASLVHQLDALARANKIDFRALRLTGSLADMPSVAAAKPPPADDAAATAKGRRDEQDWLPQPK